MRIIHIEDRFHPDMGYQINFLSRYHSSEDEFIIITSTSLSIWNVENDEALLQRDREFEKKYKVSIIRLPAFFARGDKSFVWIRQLTNKLLSLNPDVVYVHCIESFSSARVFLRRKIGNKCQIVTDTHSLYNQFRTSLKFKIYMLLLKKFVVKNINRNSYSVFYTAEENRQILSEVYEIRRDLIFPGLIGTDLDLFKYDEKEAEKKLKELSISQGKTTILYTGKINNIKKPHLLLEAIKLIENKISEELTILFVGSVDQEYYDQHCKIRFKNSLIQTIFHPMVPNNKLYIYYSLASFAVFPRHNTLSSLDAQACRLPIIMESDQTNDVRLKMGGLTFRPGETNDLADKILMLIEDPDLREKLSMGGYEFIKENYDYRKIILNMEKIIHKVNT